MDKSWENKLKNSNLIVQVRDSYVELMQSHIDQILSYDVNDLSSIIFKDVKELNSHLEPEKVIGNITSRGHYEDYYFSYENINEIWILAVTSISKDQDLVHDKIIEILQSENSNDLKNQKNIDALKSVYSCCSGIRTMADKMFIEAHREVQSFQK